MRNRINPYTRAMAALRLNAARKPVDDYAKMRRMLARLKQRGFDVRVGLHEAVVAGDEATSALGWTPLASLCNLVGRLLDEGRLKPMSSRKRPRRSR